VRDIWTQLRTFTQARIGLGRSGSAVPTSRLLEFQLAHAQARDAVLRVWDVESFAKVLGEDSILVTSQVDTRDAFLKRPDLGRQLSPASRAALQPSANELAIIVSDGLSSKAIETHFLPFWKVFAPQIRDLQYSPLVLAPYARVALSDEVGAALGAKLSIIFIGERPGLSSSDSMGIYLTYHPKLGNHDANRNCISNIRPPDGLSYEQASAKLTYLIRESLRRQLSGVNLKEDAQGDQERLFARPTDFFPDRRTNALPEEGRDAGAARGPGSSEIDL
jgi:ethanolamine ammonia-lyase small subunit